MELLRKCNLLWNTAVGKIFSGFHAIQSLFCWAVQSGEKAEPITGRQHVGPFGGVAPYLRWQMMYDGKGTGFLIPLGLGNRDQAPSFALTFRKMQVNLLPWMSSKLISGCRFPPICLSQSRLLSKCGETQESQNDPVCFSSECSLFLPYFQSWGHRGAQGCPLNTRQHSGGEDLL